MASRHRGRPRYRIPVALGCVVLALGGTGYLTRDTLSSWSRTVLGKPPAPPGASLSKASHRDQGRTTRPRPPAIRATTTRSTASITWVTARSPRTWTVARTGTDSNGHGPWTGHIRGTQRSFTFTRLLPGRTYTFTVVGGGQRFTVKATAKVKG